MHDGRIIEEFNAIANGRLPGRGRIVDMEDLPKISRIKFEDFISNIEIQIWDRLSFGWVKGYEKLKEYVKQKHNARVPQRYIDESGFGLGGWVSHRRTAYKKGELSSDHIQQLEEVKGWVWNQDEGSFQEGLKKLKEYAGQNHNAIVSARYTDESGFKLGSMGFQSAQGTQK